MNEYPSASLKNKLEDLLYNKLYSVLSREEKLAVLDTVRANLYHQDFIEVASWLDAEAEQSIDPLIRNAKRKAAQALRNLKVAS